MFEPNTIHQGDCRELITQIEDDKGRIKKGEHRSPATEFKKGQHWRNVKPYWNQEWLYQEYVVKQRSSVEIASEFGVKDANILYFLRKFGIARRTASESKRLNPYKGLSGEQNPMYGRTGSANPNWRGGIARERQSFYASAVWKRVVSAVWKRDGARCRVCSKHRDDVPEMHIHHIVGFAYVPLRAELTNLMLVCENCHQWIHSKANIDKLHIGEYPSIDEDFSDLPMFAQGGK